MFTRAIKLPPSGSGAKKLTQRTRDMIKEMSFVRPYVKNTQDLPSNLPVPPSSESQELNCGESTRDGEEDVEPDERSDSARNETENVLEQPAEATTLQPKGAKQVAPRTTKKRKLSELDKESEVDSCVMDYLRKKQVDSDNPKRLFLLSLLPDLEQMNNEQMRQFRCKVSELIDQILTTRTVVTPASWQSGSAQDIPASNPSPSQPPFIQDWLRSTSEPLQNSHGNTGYDTTQWYERSNEMNQLTKI